MNIQTLLEAKVKEGFLTLFETILPTVEFQATRKDFEGDITIVVFPGVMLHFHYRWSCVEIVRVGFHPRWYAST